MFDASHLIKELTTRFETLKPEECASPAEFQERLDGLVALIGWLETHPDATQQQYRAEIQRVKRDGVPCPKVRIVVEEETEGRMAA